MGQNSISRSSSPKPLDDYLHYNYGTVLVSLGEYDSAITQFTMIMNKDDAALQNVLGYCYGMLQEYEESINCYQEALQLRSGELGMEEESCGYLCPRQ